MWTKPPGSNGVVSLTRGGNGQLPVGAAVINKIVSFYHLPLSPEDLMGSKLMWGIKSEAVAVATTPELSNEGIYYETIANRPSRKA